MDLERHARGRRNGTWNYSGDAERERDRGREVTYHGQHIPAPNWQLGPAREQPGPGMQFNGAGYGYNEAGYGGRAGIGPGAGYEQWPAPIGASMQRGECGYEEIEEFGDDVRFDDFDRQLMNEPIRSMANPNIGLARRFNSQRVDIPPVPPVGFSGSVSSTASNDGLPSGSQSLAARFAYTGGRRQKHAVNNPTTPTRGVRQTQYVSRDQLQPEQQKSTFDPEKEFPDTPVPFNLSRKAPSKAVGTQPQNVETNSTQAPTPYSSYLSLEHAPKTDRGITLVPVSKLPDRLRTVFSFEFFNAIQSKTFPAVYESNDNVVVSAPTGSGKTAIMELAICKIASVAAQGTYKVIYQAPTKALCAEKKRDWEKKFATIGLACTELTGDTDYHQISNVKNGDIIITTPEKWDSMTRKWQDHKKLLQMIKLFLVDEVHLLKDQRGATLEVVITRMKSLGTEVRFVALSATVPNSEDIATWLGKNSAYPNTPAYEERFGETYRPVKLQKFVYGFNSTGNDFIFEKTLDKMLPGLIKEHSARKPAMIFCITRQACQNTAKMLAELWASGERYWPSPGDRSFSFRDKDLHAAALSGVAFHHAGLDQNDRILVEKLFTEGVLFVICCTSTLAVGINMPAYLVILKNTNTYAAGTIKEYDDLEVMQMLGRAGRPQFDSAGVAVIMTKKENKDKYEKMVSGNEIVESCLHENLVEHMNAEIVMGTITNINTAKLWLKSTFLWVRMKRNPSHYKIEGQTFIMDVDQKLDEICEKDIHLLDEVGLVKLDTENKLKTTPYGVAMAAYYVKLETMKGLLGLEPKSKISEIISTLADAHEFKELRLRMNERPLFREINKGLGMRFPLKGDISTPAHKANILIQFELGAMEFPPGESFQKNITTMTQEKNFVFNIIHRLCRCLVDCIIEKRDSISLKNALELSRCFSAKCWENSPNQLRQLDGVGPATVKKFALANIRTLHALADLDAYKIDMIASRNPPFGANILKELKNLPVFTITVTQVSKTANRKDPVKVMCNAEIKYLNKQTPGRFKGTTMIAVFMAECDGELLHFARTPVYKLDGGKEVKFTAEVSNADQKIVCYITCEGIVGTLVSSELKPDIDPSLFPPLEKVIKVEPALSETSYEALCQKTKSIRGQNTLIKKESGVQQNGQKRTNSFGVFRSNTAIREPKDEYDEYDDPEFTAAVSDLDFSHIDGLDMTKTDDETERNTLMNSRISRNGEDMNAEDEAMDEAAQLPNGNWACKHKCGDKTKCKHMCCRDGLEKPPKISKKKASQEQDVIHVAKKTLINPANMSTTNSKESSYPKNNKKSPDIFSFLQKAGVDVVDLSNELEDDRYMAKDTAKEELQRLNKLHSSSGTRSSVSLLKGKPTYSFNKQPPPDFGFVSASTLANAVDAPELPTVEQLHRGNFESTNTTLPKLFGSAEFDDDDLDAVMAQAADPSIMSDVPEEEGNNAELEMDSNFQPAQSNFPQKRKSGPFFMSSSSTGEEYITKELPNEVPQTNQPWSSSPVFEDAPLLPNRSSKRIRSKTPGSPLGPYSRKTNGEGAQHGEDRPNGDFNLMDFLGDCVDIR